jgi:mono/diheme cytochrome c family protein
MGKVLKWAGIVVGAVLLVIVLIAAGVWFNSSRHASRTYAISPRVPPFPTDSASLARGRHVVFAIAKCAGCHGDDLGGHKLVDDPAFARIYAPNLTRGEGGVGGRLSDADWMRAVRFGVGRDGKGLAIMPSNEFVHLSDADLAAAIAYVKGAPAVNRTTPTRKLGPIATALVGTGKVRLFRTEVTPHDVQSVAAPNQADTIALGRYLVDAGGCAGCHGPGLAGGPIPVAPPGTVPASNLTRGGIAGTYTEAQFVAALRTGKRPGGAALNEFMPWPYVGQMTDAELHAVWRYLQSVPARSYGEK